MKKTLLAGGVLLTVLAGLGVGRADAQSFSINWSTIDGGGGISTSGGYSLSGTIGQPDAGMTFSGGNFSVSGGFWVLSVLQSPGAPLLTMFRTATNTLVLSWPSPSTGFYVQQTTNLNGAVWTTPSETINDNGTNKVMVVNPPAGNRFYRLVKP
jgi:hypothetical protein